MRYVKFFLGQLVPDSKVRVSTKTLAIGCLANAISMTPKVFLLTLFSDDEEEDLVDCQTANRDALKSQAHNNYVPRCTHDGRYEQIQCYKVINTLLNLTG